MKVLDLQCAHGHRFEGWFASDDDLAAQRERGLLRCPSCGDATIARMPSAPRLNLAHAQPEPAPAAPSEKPTTVAAHAEPELQLQALWLQAVAQVVRNTEDVGERFPEEARRIHYGEAPRRGIRGQATPEQRADLADEGIEVLPLALPPGAGGPSH